MAAQVNIQFFYLATQRLWSKLPSSVPLWSVLFPSIDYAAPSSIAVGPTEKRRVEEQLGYLVHHPQAEDHGLREGRAASSLDHFRFYSHFVCELVIDALDISPLVLAEIRRRLPDGSPLFPSLHSLTWAEPPSCRLSRTSILAQLQHDVAPKVSHLSLTFADGAKPQNLPSQAFILERIAEAAATFPCLQEITIGANLKCTLPVDILRMFPTIQDAYLDCTVRDRLEHAASGEQSLLNFPQNVCVRTLHLNWDDSDLEALASAVDLGAIECLNISRSSGHRRPFLTALNVISGYVSVGLVHLEIDSGIPSEGINLPFVGFFMMYAGPLRQCR
ncbi:hypothetical protein C8Q78DRAFT_1082313 [Trametes maxima]|nr:hypothetical protein C8Q78DRAFT_1082313 [Trametes maxima]